MLRKIFFVCLLSLSMIQLNAQYVNIPDSNFRKYLITLFPSAMVGNTLDTSNAQVIGATTVLCDSLFIQSLDGIQYFDALQYLDCKNNMLTYLPTLSNTVSYINCNVNMLDSLPNLPTNLLEISCASNHITHLPTLPANIQKVDCSFNAIDTLYPFTNSIVYFDCSSNLISTLPSFPNSIQSFYCQHNSIINIPTLTNNLQQLNTSFNPIYNLPTLPNSLLGLWCNGDSLTILPTLPTSLQFLECSNNILGNLPTLPNSLLTLFCANDSLNSLPTLPNLLQQLNCDYNNLINLPSLPSTLIGLSCRNNFIPQLPTLPNGLEYLNYSKNPITTLPSLSSALKNLIWNENTTTPQLPTLPNGLEFLEVCQTHLDSLPNLPNSITKIYCYSDSLLFLPTLPSNLSELNCSSNFITTIPTIPSTVQKLYIGSNLIDTLNYLPPFISEFICAGNSNLSCLPKLPSNMFWLDIANTAITCLPNFVHIEDFGYASSNVTQMGLCTPSSGCSCNWNIAGNIHADTSTTCLLDSINPGNRVKNLKVKMYSNSVQQDEMEITSNGEYSFDTYNNNLTYTIEVDTINTPFKVKCPVTTTQDVTLTPIDSLKPNINFGVECIGIDAGVKSIYSRFRPATLSHIEIKAGDLAQFYNVQCSSVNFAIVTIKLDGPVIYTMPSANALTPNTVVNNVLTYVVPNISAVNFNTAFGIEIMTDNNASMGDMVCIETKISSVINDMNLGNNQKTVCFPVVNSFDPNAKFVTPFNHSQPNDSLIYTIQFQNTGNDTAYNVTIKDTLSNNLNVNTFELLGSSHEVNANLVGNILTFHFTGINLLDMKNHEPESHGWVQFSIRLKNNLQFGTKTENIAHIYFDNNDPIVTNTATNFIGIDPTYEVGDSPIDLPTAFSPNGDGLNDGFHILNLDYLNTKNVKVNSIRIVNRWGETVFQSTNNNFDWKPVSQTSIDNYVYFVNYSTFSGNTYVQKGEVVIVK